MSHITVGQKFALKIHLVINGAQSQVQVWQDGTKLFDRSNSTTGFIDLGSNTSMNVLRLGAEHVMQDGDMIADDIVLKTVTAGQAAPRFTASTPPATATVGAAYTYTFAASGTPAPTFRVSSGALPAGLSLNTTTGVLSGTPTTAGTSTFTVAASNGVSPDAVTPSRTITVNAAQAAPGFTAATPPATATVGAAYTYTFAASGNPAPTFRVSSGALPAGLTLNTTTGVLSGTPTTAGTSTFTVPASNGVSPDAVTPSRTITVNAAQAAPGFTAATPPATATVGAAYTYTFAASGNPAPTFRVSSGALPAGLSLNTTTGVLSGTPTTAGTSTFTVAASNGVSPDAVTPSRTITVNAAQAAPGFTAATPPATATVGAAYTYTFAASGNPAPTFRVSSGALPAGLSLNTTTGVLSGTPTAAGPATFTVTATNGVSPDAVTASITITVNPDTTAPTAPTNLTAVAGSGQISLAWNASTDNVGVTRYNISRNGAPIGTATGTSFVDGTVIAGTTYSYTVTAQDAAGNVSPPSNTATATASGVRTITIDKLVTAHQGTNAATVSAAGLTTTGSNQLILAFISSDGPSSGGTASIRSVSGAGLSWTLRQRTNAQAGTAEIWQAVAPGPLTNATITATQNSGSWQSAMTVVAFNNADTAQGATAGGSAATGAPSASLTTTRAGSWVWGVGTDWNAPLARTVGPAQTLVDQYFPPAGDTYWLQRQTGQTATSGTVVTINDTAPTTDRWDLALIEILAAP